MFQLEQLTKTKILDVLVLSKKSREPGEDPGAQLHVEVVVSNDLLPFFDGHLKGFLYRKGKSSDPQQDLDGMPPVSSDSPDLSSIGQHIGGWLRWSEEGTGYTISFDYGAGGASNTTLFDCKVHSYRLKPQGGGSVRIRYVIDAPSVAGKTWPRIVDLKGKEAEQLMSPPQESGQADIEDAAPTGRRKSSGKAREPAETAPRGAEKGAARGRAGQGRKNAPVALVTDAGAAV